MKKLEYSLFRTSRYCRCCCDAVSASCLRWMLVLGVSVVLLCVSRGEMFLCFQVIREPAGSPPQQGSLDNEVYIVVFCLQGRRNCPARKIETLIRLPSYFSVAEKSRRASGGKTKWSA